MPEHGDKASDHDRKVCSKYPHADGGEHRIRNTMLRAGPDPQAFRPPKEQINVLQVRLPTNFKATRFQSDKDTAILRRLQADIVATRFTADDGSALEIPVKLKVHDSVFVPLAKWAMLIAGNYRCIGRNEMRTIQEAVHSDIAATETFYTWVVDLCI
jgi:hypothetical protein